MTYLMRGRHCTRGRPNEICRAPVKHRPVSRPSRGRACAERRWCVPYPLFSCFAHITIRIFLQKHKDELQQTGHGAKDGGTIDDTEFDECEKLVFDIVGSEIVDGVCKENEGENEGDAKVL